MRSLTQTLLLVLLASGFAGVVSADTNSQATLPANVKGAYKELPEDLKLIRKTYLLRNPDKPVNASSGEAGGAATRIFKKVDFIGMRREAILALLGDPKTISDYGVAAKKGKDEPLVYRFDSGFGGQQFTLHFRDDVVTKLETRGID